MIDKTKKIFIIPTFIFISIWIYFYFLGVKYPFETAFQIFGTQLVLSYTFLFIGLHFSKSKYHNELYLFLIFIFIGYNVLFFNYEGMDKTDEIVHNVKYMEIFEPTKKYYCETDSDCILSYTDPKNFQICVNENYFENAEIINYLCLKTENISCLCENNKCIRDDYRTGCE